MPYTDDSHEFARQIKEVEDRVQDLESKNRTSTVPNPLISLSDSYSYADDVAVTLITAQNGTWGQTDWHMAQWQ